MTFSTLRRVEFRDTDAAGIVHFSAFFTMMEAAEHELLRSLGMSVMPKPEPGKPLISWPRVAASCNFMAAAHFEDLLRISVEVAEIGSSSVRYQFRFTRDEALIAEGTSTVVCCRLPGDEAAGRAAGKLEKIPIPDQIREQLQKHQ